MALKGIKVIEMLGLAPGPFCGMILAEFGASVTMIDKMQPTMVDVLGSGKKNIALDLKNEKAVKIVREMCKNSDVIIEPFRPGVMEKLGLGPQVLMQDNPKLIYARLTGYGQNGDFYKKGGHDINYVSLSGLLSILREKDSNPSPPINFAADFAGGGLMCSFGIVMALLERMSSNRGQIIDSNMVEGTAYISSWLYRSQKLPIWGNDQGENVLDGGAHFYRTYKTKDGKFMAVGAIEPKFYENLLSVIDYPLTDMNQFTNFDEQKSALTKIFLTRTQKEWCDIFDNIDACVTPVLSMEDAPHHPHNKTRDSFSSSYDGQMVPNPAPKLSRTPATSLASKTPSKHGEHTQQTLLSLNYSQKEIKKLHNEGVIFVQPQSRL